MNIEDLFSWTQAGTPALTTLARQLLDSWRDPEYRVQFVRERVQSSVALQVRALREQRNAMTQAQLAERMGKAQPWISQLENPEYGKMSVATLLDLAEAFDADLEIKFRPFSRSLYELSRQDREYFQVPSFEEELPALEQAAASGWSAVSGKWNDLTRAAAILYPSQQIALSYTPQVAPQPRLPEVIAGYQMPLSSFSPSWEDQHVVPLLEGQKLKDKRHRQAKGVLKGAA
jgi:transcriptional regulator with XRE-family HTH domain